MWFKIVLLLEQIHTDALKGIRDLMVRESDL